MDTVKMGRKSSAVSCLIVFTILISGWLSDDVYGVETLLLRCDLQSSRPDNHQHKGLNIKVNVFYRTCETGLPCTLDFTGLTTGSQAYLSNLTSLPSNCSNDSADIIFDGKAYLYTTRSSRLGCSLRGNNYRGVLTPPINSNSTTMMGVCRGMDNHIMPIPVYTATVCGQNVTLNLSSASSLDGVISSPDDPITGHVTNPSACQSQLLNMTRGVEVLFWLERSEFIGGGQLSISSDSGPLAVIDRNQSSVRLVMNSDIVVVSYTPDVNDTEINFKLKYKVITCEHQPPSKSGMTYRKQEFWVSGTNVTYDCLDSRFYVPYTGVGCVLFYWQYNSTLLECVPVPYCTTSPPEVPMAEVVISSDKLSATYTCELGYKASTNEASWHISCESSDPETSPFTWAAPQVPRSCVPVPCSQPFLPHGRSNATTQPVFGDEISFQCHEGYFLFGPKLARCEHDSNWSALPACVSNKDLCEFTQPVVENSNQTLVNNTKYSEAVKVLKITCLPGFKLAGTDEMWCSRNAKWSQTPVCLQDGEDDSSRDTFPSDTPSTSVYYSMTIVLGVMTALLLTVILIGAIFIRRRLWKSKSSEDKQTSSDTSEPIYENSTPMSRIDGTHERATNELDEKELYQSLSTQPEAHHYSVMGN